jgi:proline dehydrogenase
VEFVEIGKAYERFTTICSTAAASNVKIFVDAEESWIQDTIDAWSEAMIFEHNKDTAIIYNTIQMYRHDRVAYLKNLVDSTESKNIYCGLKIVRGAYMEKERERALKMNYQSPIQPDKESSDKDYNDGIHYCLDHERVFVCAGTHNENSSLKLTQWMAERKVPNNSPRFYFAQLLGMSDHLSFNLAASGYNVAKYVPYGPIPAVLPYLSRRAQENSSVKGQVGRELGLIKQELQRRKNI